MLQQVPKLFLLCRNKFLSSFYYAQQVPKLFLLCRNKFLSSLFFSFPPSNLSLYLFVFTAIEKFFELVRFFKFICSNFS